MPVQYADTSSLIGKGVAQAKQSPPFDSEKNKKFWELEGEEYRTFFGRMQPFSHGPKYKDGVISALKDKNSPINSPSR